MEIEPDSGPVSRDIPVEPDSVTVGKQIESDSGTVGREIESDSGTFGREIETDSGTHGKGNRDRLRNSW